MFSKCSFPDDSQLLIYVSSINCAYSGLFALETDIDRIPIVAFAYKSGIARVHEDEYPPEGAAVSSGGAGDTGFAGEVPKPS